MNKKNKKKFLDLSYTHTHTNKRLASEPTSSFQFFFTSSKMDFRDKQKVT